MISKLGIDVINALTISELDALKYIEANKKSVLNMIIHDLSLKTYSRENSRHFLRNRSNDLFIKEI